MNKNRIVLLAGSAVVAAFGSVAVGCGGAHLSVLKEAASDDLHCAKGQVRILTKSGKTRDVEACGQQATYKWDGDDWRMIGRGGAPAVVVAPVMKGAAPGVAPAQPAPVMTPMSNATGTPSQPPPSQPPPSQPPPAPPGGGKQL